VRSRVGVVVAAVVLVVLLVLIARSAGGLGGALDDLLGSGQESTQQAPAGSAVAALDRLPVKGKAPKTGYSREQFGQAWQDVDANGCDTRDDVLARDMTDVVYSRSDPCQVSSGVLVDPYTPKEIRFQRGPRSAEVQIDHLVALSDAWQTGAQQWSPQQREQFANDPLNLLAVDGPLNSAKGDGDAATWLPPNKGFRCQYVARQIAVKTKYGAWVTQPEHDAMADVLSTCPHQALPRDDGGVGPQPAPSGAATAVSDGAATPTAPYASCSAAKAAGAAPLRSGDPGWNPRLDRDGDGVACA
jgi:hypothetical protein